MRPHRSALYIPGSNSRALEKARGLAVDVILFDLEDAVAPDEKINARNTLAEALKKDYGPRKKIVRINGLDTEWGADDAAAAATMNCDAVLVPKVDGAMNVSAVAQILGDKPIWAMMETPLGIRDAMRTSLQLCMLAARAHGVVAVDGVYNAFKDEDGLRAECNDGRDMGFDGKSLIHPAQVAICNEVFGPSAAEIELAERQIAAFEAAEAEGKGVAVVDGKIVENLHIVTARATLAKAKAIAELESQ